MTARVRTVRVLALGSALLIAASLGGCGKVGQLERPGPMFGKDHTTAKGASKDAGDGGKQDPTRPVETVDPRDRSTDPGPVRTLRVPGTNPSATDPAPASALPDPYANPRG